MTKVWAVQGAITVVVVALAVLLADLFVDGDRPKGLPALGVLVVGAALAWRWAHAAWRHWSYEVAERTLELRHGVVLRTHSAIPYFRVQHVDVSQGPVERALGLSRLVVHTAAASTDAEIPGVPTERAEALRQVILERTGSGDAV